MNEQPRLRRILERINLPNLSRQSTEGETAHRGRWRLLALLFLFDSLLIVATLLSFQKTELIEEEITLEQTRVYYDIVIREQIITNTKAITKIIPYGSTPPPPP